MRIKPIYIIIAGLLIVVAAFVLLRVARDTTATEMSEDGAEVRRDEAADAATEYRIDEVDDGAYIEVTGVEPDRQSEVLDAFKGCQEGG